MWMLRRNPRVNIELYVIKIKKKQLEPKQDFRANIFNNNVNFISDN